MNVGSCEGCYLYNLYSDIVNYACYFVDADCTSACPCTTCLVKPMCTNSSDMATCDLRMEDLYKVSKEREDDNAKALRTVQRMHNY